MKRTLAFVFAILLTLSLLPGIANAESTPVHASETKYPTKQYYYASKDKFEKTCLDGMEFKYTDPTDNTEHTVAWDSSSNKFKVEEPGTGAVFAKGTIEVHYHYYFHDDYHAEGDVNLYAVDKMFAGIRITSDADFKKDYLEGQKIDPSSLKMALVYKDKDGVESTEEVKYDDSGIGYSPSVTTPLKTTDTKVRVSYTKHGVASSSDIAITVAPTSQSVTLNDGSSALSSPLNLKVGDKKEITVVLDSSVNADAWDYVIDDTSVLSVKKATIGSGKGIEITALAVGTAKVTVRSKGSNIDASFTVVVSAKTPPADPTLPTKIYLNYTTEQQIPIGSTLSLKAVGFDPFTATQKDVTWSTGDANVATVSSDGLVKGIALGTTTITCTSKVAKDPTDPTKPLTATCAVKVIDMPVTSITLNEKTATMYIKGTALGTKQMIATVLPDNATNKAVTWASANDTIVSVDANGLMTARKVGTTTVTATAGGGISATVTVTVKEGVLLDSVVVTPEVASLYVGQTLTAALSVGPSKATTKTVTWKSDNTDVATVSTSGRITAVAPGYTTITATANDGSGLFDTVKVTVSNVAVESVLMTTTTASVLESKTVQLYASIYPSTATNKGVTWASLNTAVATVSSSGLVTGVSKGTVVIRATAKDGSGNFADCVVSVAERTRVSSLKINYKSFTLVLNDSTYLTATILPADATIQNVEWESSDTGVATISSSGLLKGIALGTTVVTATADGKSTSITVTVANSRSAYGVVVNCARRVNVRSVPDGSRGFLGYAYRGQTYKVIGESGNWWKIQYESDTEGYIWKNYMSFDTSLSYVSATSSTGTGTGTTTVTPPATTLTGSVVTVTNCRRRVNVRATPDAAGTFMGYALLNESFSYIATEGDWYKINYNGVVAYIHSAYCSLSI